MTNYTHITIDGIAYTFPVELLEENEVIVFRRKA